MEPLIQLDGCRKDKARIPQWSPIYIKMSRHLWAKFLQYACHNDAYGMTLCEFEAQRTLIVATSVLGDPKKYNERIPHTADHLGDRMQ